MKFKIYIIHVDTKIKFSILKYKMNNDKGIEMTEAQMPKRSIVLIPNQRWLQLVAILLLAYSTLIVNSQSDKSSSLGVRYINKNNYYFLQVH